MLNQSPDRTLSGPNSDMRELSHTSRSVQAVLLNNMKYIFLALCLSVSSAFAGSLKSEPLTTADIASILHISAKRYALSFGSPEELIFRYETPGSGKKDSPVVVGKGKRFSVVVFEEGKGNLRSLGFIVGGRRGSTTTFFPAPEAEAPDSYYERTTIDHDIFSVTGSLKKDFSTILFQIQILPKSKAAEPGAAANP